MFKQLHIYVAGVARRVAETSGSQTVSRPAGSRRADRPPPVPHRAPSADALTRPLGAGNRRHAASRPCAAVPQPVRGDRPRSSSLARQPRDVSLPARIIDVRTWWRRSPAASVELAAAAAAAATAAAAAAAAAASTSVEVVCVTVGRLRGRPGGGGSFFAADTLCAGPGCRQQAACHGGRPVVARRQAAPAGGDTPVAGGGRSTAGATRGAAAADGAAVTTASGRLRRPSAGRPGVRRPASGGDALPAPAPHHTTVLGVGWFPAADRVCRRRQRLPPLPHGRA